MTGVATRLTHSGWGCAGFGTLLVTLGTIGGNNLVVLVGAVFLSVLVADLFWGRVHVRGLRVRRSVPDELYQGLPARIEWVVDGSARGVWLEDAGASVAVDSPIDTVVVSGWWRGLQRGWFQPGPIRLVSRFPFGTFEHARVVPTDLRVVVFPEPVSQTARPNPPGANVGDRADTGLGQGEMNGLRPYRTGDRRGAIHLPTSERTGEPMVVQRAPLRQPAVRIRVDLDAPLEAELSRCADAILTADRNGLAIGLSGLGPGLDAPRRGVRWRRHLLEALALVTNP